ncbi:hypothetical protein HY407_02915, partial [Candidatus Gottesmanbacteria bacterium]|nr:hypothetical protein [Candidatus Gottesmanbacteria bacterium]
MKRQLIIILFLSINVLFLPIEGISAQENSKDNPALFGQLQDELAGDPTGWQWRDPDESNDGIFVKYPLTPDQLINREDKARSDPKNDPSPEDPNIKKSNNFDKNIFDADSWKGSFIRTLINIGSDQGNFFSGDYTVPTTAESEIGKIKEIYTHITNTVTKYGKPVGGEIASLCLTGGRGECRHMGAVLQESLEEAGVKSELIVSADHVWVRVTLTDPPFDGITFDLDPTWYQQPIPLPPRSNTPISSEWREKILAIVTAPKGGLDLNGQWSGFGGTYTGRHTGNSISLISTEGPALIGSLSGTSFTGQIYLVADSCPGLNRYFPAKGTVSNSTITVTFTSPKYDLSECYDLPGTESEKTASYSRV